MVKHLSTLTRGLWAQIASAGEQGGQDSCTVAVSQSLAG